MGATALQPTKSRPEGGLPVTSLRVVSIDLVARLADLLDHNEVAVLFDHPFDVWLDGIWAHSQWNGIGSPTSWSSAPSSI
jgi:hypothetical protein